MPWPPRAPEGLRVRVWRVLGITEPAVLEMGAIQALARAQAAKGA